MATTQVKPIETLYEHAGKEEGLRDVIAAFYARVLADELLQPLFGDGQPTHVDHLTAWFSEVFGGPKRYSEELGGFPSLLAAHRHKNITEPQRARFVELFMRALDEHGTRVDEPYRSRVLEYMEFGTEVALQNSHAESESALHECQEVPLWDW